MEPKKGLKHFKSSVLLDPCCIFAKIRNKYRKGLKHLKSSVLLDPCCIFAKVRNKNLVCRCHGLFSSGFKCTHYVSTRAPTQSISARPPVASTRLSRETPRTRHPRSTVRGFLRPCPVVVHIAKTIFLCAAYIWSMSAIGV